MPGLMLRLAPIVAVLLTVVASPMAHARPFTPAELDAYVVAIAYMQDRGDGPGIVCEQLPALSVVAPTDLPAGRDGEFRFRWPGVPACAIDISEAVASDWRSFCAVVVHEEGHRRGHPHTQDPSDIMYEGEIPPIPECSPEGVRLAERQVRFLWESDVEAQQAICTMLRRRATRYRKAHRVSQARKAMATRRQRSCERELAALKRFYAPLGWTLP
jgi:hypothetical protein